MGADVKYLSKLDVAICNHSMRADLLAVLTKITSPKKVYGDKVTLTLNYIQWVVARKVKLLELMVGLEDIQGVVEGIRFFAPIPSIQKVYFDEPTDENGCQVDFNPSVGMFAVFLSKFPSLKGFSGWWTMTDDHLAIVRSFGYNLEKVDIMSCPFLSSSAVAAFISSVAHSLLEVECSSLDDEGLLALSGQSFPVLNDITVNAGTSLMQMLLPISVLRWRTLWSRSHFILMKIIMCVMVTLPIPASIVSLPSWSNLLSSHAGT